MVSANGRAQPEFIYKLSSTGYEIKEKTVVHHFPTDGDFTYIVAVSPADGNTSRIHGFSDSLSEFEKLMTAANLRVLDPDQAEAVADFYRAANPENRSMTPISSMFDLKQAAERQCQAIPFDTGDRQFEVWWKKAKPLYAGIQFSQTAIPRDNGYLVEWIVLSSAGSGACGGAPLRARLEVNSDGHIGKLSFLPLRSGNRYSNRTMQADFTYDRTPNFVSVAYKFTGKERDAESGLDYFGARYYGSMMGRFMSPDPLLNSGHPDDPQSWNRYSYVRNNPLSRIDPTGLYDFSACAKGDSNCQGEKDRFNAAVKKANDLLKNMDPKSKEAKALSKALGALGSAGDKNGVTVSFGKTSTGGAMETLGMHITVDFNLENAAQQTWRKAGYTIDGTVDDASDEAHEGTHVANNKRGRSGGDESEAYRTGSYVGEAGHCLRRSAGWPRGNQLR